ncbi:uncharacterized protein LOC115702485 [Cannabis sativa]|uniref:uncharacterized protein LOC115702485 n=1 Tax=Cannabis sativa TaxID=3483 RepID=UPI0029CA3289|nr:uncharacterized protein LOC115702485 [Cannabis sativa]
MESITEEQLIQMVRDFIESESSSAPQISAISSSEPQPSYDDTLEEMIWRETTDIEVEILEKILMYMRNIESLIIEPQNLKKWVVLWLKMDGYEASLCKTTWVFFNGGAKGHYEFLDVITNGTRVIIDLEFRSQFELARPTQRYKKLIEALPSFFIGTEEKLGNVVTLLCSAAKESLKESGLHIPPWRKDTYMHSKWFSENCKKISFSPNTTTTTTITTME